MVFTNDELEVMKSWFQCFVQNDIVDLDETDYAIAIKIMDHLGYATIDLVEKLKAM